jgi:hypothetical protein
MTAKQALGFVKTNGITLESGRGPVPSLAETIAGEALRGSWWAHSSGPVIFLCSRAIRESKEVLVCRLAGGKVTYVHRRLWPALVRLAGQFDARRLDAIHEVHTATGKHKVETTAFPKWVPPVVGRAAARLTLEQATAMLRNAGIITTPVGRGRRPRREVTSICRRRVAAHIGGVSDPTLQAQL